MGYILPKNLQNAVKVSQTTYRVTHKYLNDFLKNGCGIQMNQATPTKFMNCFTEKSVKIEKRQIKFF
jgi:hypothetical protein